MLYPFTFMLALLPDDQIRILSFENVINDVLLVNFHQIVFQFVHQSMEKLINVHLNSWVNGLAFRDESFTESFCGEDLTVRVFQISKDFLNLISDIFRGLNGPRVYLKQWLTKLLDMIELLKQGIDIASGREIL